MVNYRNPVILERDYLALKSLYQTTFGIYLWEYFMTLDYEINIIRGRRPYRWTIWIYSLTRASTLMAVILNLVDLNTTTPLNCEVWIIFESIFGYLGVVASSFLIAVRIIAIWNKNKIAMAIAIGLWVINVGAIIHGMTRLRADWDPSISACFMFNSDDSKLNIIVTFVTDIASLLAVLVGLLRLRGDGLGTFGVGRLLWNQGVIWLFIAAISELFPMVFLILNLNDPLNFMFQIPSLIATSIAATRMYRSLTDFVSGTADTMSDSFRMSSNVSKVQWNRTPCNRIHVTVDTSSDGHRMSRVSQRDVHVSTGEGLCEKPHGLTSDPENPVEDRDPGVESAGGCP